MPRARIIPEEDVIDPPLPYRAVDATKWWNQTLSETLNDAEFEEAALHHYLVVSDDRNVRAIRKRSYNYLRIIHDRDLAADIAAYKRERDQ